MRFVLAAEHPALARSGPDRHRDAIEPSPGSGIGRGGNCERAARIKGVRRHARPIGQSESHVGCQKSVGRGAGSAVDHLEDQVGLREDQATDGWLRGGGDDREQSARREELPAQVIAGFGSYAGEVAAGTGWVEDLVALAGSQSPGQVAYGQGSSVTHASQSLNGVVHQAGRINLDLSYAAGLKGQRIADGKRSERVAWRQDGARL